MAQPDQNQERQSDPGVRRPGIGFRLEQCIRVRLGNDVGYPNEHAADMEHEIVSMKEVESSARAAWQPILHV